MKKEKKQRIAQVRIHDISQNGNGLGTYDHPNGMKWTLEVPFTTKDDLAEVLILKKHDQVHTCRLLQILESAPSRTAPRCKHFATCGGCRWQHLSYTEQLERKEQFVRHCFSDIATPSLTIHPILPSQDPWEYRNKMEFSFSSNREGDKFLGLILASSRGKVINLTECHLVHPWFIQGLTAARQWWIDSDLLAYHPSKNSGSLRTLTLREGMRTGDRMAILTVSGNPDYALKERHLQGLVAALRNAVEIPGSDNKLSIFLRIQQIAKGSPTNFYEMLLYGPDSIKETMEIQASANSKASHLEFNISPAAFFQPNTSQAEKLYSLVLQRGQIPSDAVVYDLYCGTGTLGICLAKHVKEVVGVEISAESSLDARTNITLNGISNMRVITGSVGKILADNEQTHAFPPPDVVVVDPPRAGLDSQTIQLLVKLKPDQIIYVSCNPVTQASNVGELIQGGYRLESLQPVDQFPQTVHIENIAILKLETKK